jgi:hypothetical protein
MGRLISIHNIPSNTIINDVEIGNPIELIKGVFIWHKDNFPNAFINEDLTLEYEEVQQ